MTSTTGLITTTPPPVSNLIKADTLGRARRTREHRERIRDEYELSGLSGVKFAAPVTSILEQKADQGSEDWRSPKLKTDNGPNQKEGASFL